MICIVPKLIFTMSSSQEQFRITIDSFDGPLDLLLYLVKRAEVDIYEIPIAQIADDYLEVIRTSAAIDVEMAGEFLVMAATLIELKSRSLVPIEKFNDDENHIESSINYFSENIDTFIIYEKDSRWLDSFIEKYNLAKKQIESLT